MVANKRQSISYEVGYLPNIIGISSSMEEKKLIKRNDAVARAASKKGSYMSDSKWAKLLQAIWKSECKFFGDNRNPVLAKTLTEEQLWVIRLEDYLGDGKYTADYIAGPIRTKEIEYIIIPFQSKDELYKTKELIDSLGKYEYDIDEIERTITLFGYR